MHYSTLVELIDTSDFVEFAPYGTGVSDEWIAKAEVRLNLALPSSYKWWLKHYSGGEIFGEEIYSIYEKDFDTVVGGDIVAMSIVNARSGVSRSQQLFLCEASGTDESFYFATNEGHNNEYPIYRRNLSDDNSTIYAQSFFEFLQKRILEHG